MGKFKKDKVKDKDYDSSSSNSYAKHSNNLAFIFNKRIIKIDKAQE